MKQNESNRGVKIKKVKDEDGIIIVDENKKKESLNNNEEDNQVIHIGNNEIGKSQISNEDRSKEMIQISPGLNNKTKNDIDEIQNQEEKIIEDLILAEDKEISQKENSNNNAISNIQDFINQIPISCANNSEILSNANNQESKVSIIDKDKTIATSILPDEY